MKNVKNNKGITLMALVITIILLIILASIGTYSGIQVVKSAQFTAFSTELKIMQTQVNKLYEEKRNGNYEYVDGLGEAISSNTAVQTQANIVFTQNESGITDQNGYIYFDTNTIKSLNIEGVEGEFFINIYKRSVVSYDGFEYEGTTYYTLEQLPDGLYNVEYNNTNNWDSSKDSFDIEYNEVEEGKYRITVSNIDYKSGNINKWQVKYKKENEDDWKQSNNYSFIIDEVGNYRVKIANNNVESNEKQIMAKGVRLPSEFQEVEYIESTGTQYIDTEVVPTINTKMGIKLACLDSSSSAVNWSGSVLSGNNGWFAVGSYGSSENLVSLFCVNARAGVRGVPFDNNFHEYYVSNGLQKIDSITFNNTITSYNKTMLNIHLFKGKNNYGGSITGLQKIKYCKLWEEDNLIRNLVPCYRKSDNKPGLYDLVNNEFYTNQGTGDFEKGNDNDGGEIINTIIINNM